MNLYTFVDGSPTVLVDPEGLQPAPSEPQIRVNQTEGNKSVQELSDLIESKNEPVIDEEVTSASGKGGSRHDRRLSNKMLEGKAIDLSKKTYRKPGGELNWSAIKSRIGRDVRQLKKHLGALREATATINKTVGGKITHLTETMIYVLDKHSPSELRQFQKQVGKIVTSVYEAEGIKLGIGAISRTSQQLKSTLQNPKVVQAAGHVVKAAKHISKPVMGLLFFLSFQGTAEAAMRGDYGTVALDAIEQTPNPVGAGIGAGRAGWSLGEAINVFLPEHVQDAIGGTINEVINEGRIE
jgi:hypothetical protein